MHNTLSANSLTIITLLLVVAYISTSPIIIYHFTSENSLSIHRAVLRMPADTNTASDDLCRLGELIVGLYQCH